jgi:hypothetical protein
MADAVLHERKDLDCAAHAIVERSFFGAEVKTT